MKFLYISSYREKWISTLLLLLYFPLHLLAQEKRSTVTGSVTNERNEPVPGVSVVAKSNVTGATIGAQTAANGIYVLNGLQPGVTYRLLFSAVGFEPVESVPLALAEGAARTLNITLKEATSVLNQVVVVGYGTQRRKEITGAVVSVKAADLKDQPVTGLQQAIAGKVAGVQVLQNSGAPGGSISVRIRGLNSISAGTDPLYVVDGVPLSNDLKGLTGATDMVNITGQASFQKSPEPLSTLNPDDIASIDILKDASASAIYGSRASNGVVMISTKQGKTAGPPSFSYSMYAGFQQVSKKIKLMDAYQWSKYTYDAKNNAYLDAKPNASIDDDNATRANSSYQLPPEILPYLKGEQGLVNTDWQDALFRNAPVQNHTLSASGGNEKFQYYISGNYLDQRGLIINSGYKRYGARINLTANLTDRLKVGVNLNPTVAHYDLVNSEGPWTFDGVLSNALKASPVYPVYNADGSLATNRQNIWAYGYSGGENPVALATQIDDKLDHLRNLGSAYAEYTIIKGLKFKTFFGTDINQFNRNFFRPSVLGTYKPIQQGAPTVPKGAAQSALSINWLWENTLNYNFTANKHRFDVLAGYTSQKNVTRANETYGTGFPNDAVHTLNAATVTSGTSTESQWSLISYLARVNYNFDDRYFIAASIRSDGSSRFGPNNKWGYFPAASAGWLISNEHFFKVPVISELKARVSYGASGNFQIANYASYDLLSSNGYVLGPGTGNVVNGAGLSQPANPDLTWEKTLQLNAGIDLGLFENRIYLNADYYRATTSDLLLNVPVPYSSGFATALKNIGKVRNSGVEFGLNTRNFTGPFVWNTSFNISANKNEVLQLGANNAPIISDGGNGTISQLYITKVGAPIGSYYGYLNGGVFKNQAEIDAYPHYASAKPGDRRFIDYNNDKKIDANDRTTIGSYFPKYIWGMTNDFKYKGFDLSIALQASHGNQIMNLQRRFIYNSEGNANQMIEELGYWKSPSDPGDGNSMRANRVTTGNSTQPSSFFVEDGSYVRLRNVTLGYTFDKQLFHNKIQGLRVYVSGQNVATWTHYTGYNPEVNARPDSPLSQGEDYGTYPLPRTFIAGINLSF
ncbi:TonB-linked SusC/RagA family outer membrane protein [Chitinophaga terrae (ex Kim and Jung 2007)]|uniref:SusC/RagA family TonB-linked outer membrane protein n=1 Tax=Chitinophaga terrae (ex Kim and Jung 2007) TaxID=408074 RepID=UPI00277F2752|nr:TonB-dependent receptor [Chitinophaga terrae (ex Kim and Jung 2007)]MDQ0106265.1 TonB-linked SusC/RagA family outer membrane protein [Chitinophaga terrae (ex Kim and Jung 2007)]